MNIIKLIVVFFILTVYSLHSAEYNSYIIKVKNTSKDNLLQSKSFKITPIFGKLNDKNSILQTSNEFEKYYLLNNYEELSDIEKIELNKIIEFIEPNYIYKIDQDKNVPNDYLIDEQWGLEAVNAFKAWNLATGKGIKIGMVDTGIDYLHRDLIDNIYINQKEDINNNGKFDNWGKDVFKNGTFGDLDGIDNDGNGIIDDVIGYDFIDESAENFGDSKKIDPDVFDDNGHGTIVAGVMVASHNNEIGISGIAYNSKIITARAFNYFGEGESDDIAKSIVYLANNGANVINCSFGDKYYSRLVAAAIDYAYSKGCVIVASSGNNNWDRVHYPSDHSKVISVGAMDKNFKKLFRSNFGYNLTLMAPGDDIITTSNGGGYRLASGTSLSTPFVTSAIALLLEKNPDLSINEIKTILELNSKPITSVTHNQKEAAGLLDIYKSLINSSPSEISIDTPNEFTPFRWGKDSNITVIGNVFTPLFEKYEVSIENFYLEEGIDKTYKIYSSISQVINDTLANFKNIGRSVIIDSKGNRINFPNSDVVIRLKVYLKNGKTIQRSKLIEIINEEELQINSINIFPIYSGESHQICLNVNTNYNSFLSVKMNNDEGFNEYKDDLDIYNKYHSVILKPNINKDSQFTFNIKLSRRDGQVIDTVISKELKLIDFQNYNYELKKYSLDFPADIDCKAFDYNNDGKDEIIVNKIESNHTWGKMKILSFNDDKFIPIFEDKEVLFPNAYGKINGNNILLFVSTLNSVIYEFMPNQIIPKEIFRDFNNTGLGFYDFDLDGNDELISLKRNKFSNDTLIKDSLEIYKYNNDKNSFIHFFSISLNENASDIGTYPESTKILIDDFDGNTKKEILIANKYGNMSILEYENNYLTKSIIDFDTTYSEAFQIINSDIDGDGIAEIIKFSDYLQNQNALFEYPDQITKKFSKLEIFKFQNGNYNKLDNLTLNFYGTKTNFSHTEYNYGISCGDLDKIKGDEIVMSLYPYLYIFKYNLNTLEPFFIKNGVHSEPPLIHDFDKNGIKEIAYSTLNNVEFIEINPNEIEIKSPYRVIGFSKDNDEYVIKWQNPRNSLKTQIWINDTLIDEISGSSYILKNYHTTTGIIYLKAVYANNIISAPSKHIEFYLSKGNFVKEIISSSSNITVKYSEKVPIDIQKSYFKIINLENNLQQEIKAVIFKGENEYLISFNEELKSGKYRLTIESFFDYYTNITQSFNSEFEILTQPKDKFLYFKSLKVISKSPPIIELQYSDKIDSSALNKDNYILEPFFNIQSIDIKSSDDSTVVITFNEQSDLGALGKEYVIISEKVQSANNLKMRDGKGNKMSFVFSANDIFDTWVYPNPVNFTKDEVLFFANLPTRAIVKIYTIDGVLLNTLNENDGNGGIEWDGRDNKGNRLNTGIYLYQVEDLNEQKSELNKLVIIK